MRAAHARALDASDAACARPGRARDAHARAHTRSAHARTQSATRAPPLDDLSTCQRRQVRWKWVAGRCTPRTQGADVVQRQQRRSRTLPRPGGVPGSAAETLIHCACALSLIPQFEFCRMSQSLGVGNCLPALRACAFLLHLSVTPNQDPISFECLSSRAHFSSFLVNVSAPACPVHRICSACASILTSPQPWS